MAESIKLQAQVPAIAYPIGSRSRSLLRCSLLVASILAVLAVHFLFISQFLSQRALVISIVVGSWIVILFRMWRYLRGWFDFLLKDAAYGVITQYGIYYRTYFGMTSLPWSSISRVEYLPRQRNRIDVLRVSNDSFTRPLSIHFGPSRSNASSLGEIEKIFHREGTPEKLVIENLPPESFFRL